MKYHLLLLLMLLGMAQWVGAQSVYKTPSGTKYHLASCRMVENTSQKLSVVEAIEQGLDACKICKPSVAPASLLSSGSGTAKGESNTVQCKGRTKRGTRCQHRTSIGDGYCYQHRPS
jgi:hypothetical protein